MQTCLTFVTVMQKQWVRSRTVSPSSREQTTAGVERVMRRRGGQLCWICRERERERRERWGGGGGRKEEGTDRLVCLAEWAGRDGLLLQWNHGWQVVCYYNREKLLTRIHPSLLPHCTHPHTHTRARTDNADTLWISCSDFYDMISD